MDQIIGSYAATVSPVNGWLPARFESLGWCFGFICVRRSFFGALIQAASSPRVIRTSARSFGLLTIANDMKSPNQAMRLTAGRSGISLNVTSTLSLQLMRALASGS